MSKDKQPKAPAEQGAEMIRRYGDMLTLRLSRSGNGVRKNAVQFGIK